MKQKIQERLEKRMPEAFRVCEFEDADKDLTYSMLEVLKVKYPDLEIHCFWDVDAEDKYLELACFEEESSCPKHSIRIRGTFIEDEEQEPQPLKDLSVLKWKWVRCKDDGIVRAVLAYNEKFQEVKLGSYWYHAKTLLRDFTYEDGSPICEPQEGK